MNDPAIQTETDGRRGPLPVVDIGLAAVLFGVVVRLSASFDPMPGWSGDPLTSAAPVVGLTPAISILLDLVVLLGSALVLTAEPGRRRGVVLAAGVAALAVIPALFHLSARDGNTLDDAVIGSAWLSAVFGAIAVWAACRDERRWRLAAAIVLGGVGLLAAKGLVQNFIDHPQTVAMYRQNREAILAANGWSADSAMARAYERRLFNAEATGWFGLSNVYASFMAAAVACGAALLLFAKLRGPALTRPLALLGGAAVIAGVIGLLLTGSKGAVVAAGLGLGLIALVLLPIRRLRSRPGLLVGAIVCVTILAPLAAVAAMSLLPEARANLSLLFRWFYLVGASRSIADSPIWGVGPAGFKDVYQALKPPISPEDVSSPHSVFFDWLAAYGAAGLAWVGLAVAAAVAAAKSMVARPAQAGGLTPLPPPRDVVRIAFLIVALGTAAAGATELALATPEASLVRIVGLVLWVIAAAVLASPQVASPVLAAGFGAGGLVLLAHGQIEMTPTSVTSALPWAAWIAVAAAGVRTGAPASPGLRRPLAWIGPASAIVLIGAVLPDVVGWDRALRNGAAAAAPVAQVSQRASSLAAAGRWAGPEGQALANDLSALLGRPVSQRPADFEAAMSELRLRAVEAAIPELRSALDHAPGHGPTARALSRLYLDLAFASATAGDAAARDDAVFSAVEVATRAAQLGGGSAAWGWLGTLRRSIAALRDDPSDLPAAIGAYEKAAEAAPYSVLYPAELARLHAQTGDREAAGRWAAKALELQDLTRLDPLVGLTDRQQRELRAIANP